MPRFDDRIGWPQFAESQLHPDPHPDPEAQSEAEPESEVSSQPPSTPASEKPKPQETDKPQDKPKASSGSKKEKEGEGGGDKKGKEYRAGNCNDCNRQFCLEYMNLPICKGKGAEEIFTTCFRGFPFPFSFVVPGAWAEDLIWVVR